MSNSWRRRKTRLATLLQSHGDEDEEGMALDRLLHGQSVIGKTSKTTEVDALRFTAKDLIVMGTLEYGQFGVVDVVNCKCDGRVYVCKSIDKHFALKNSQQCFPQVERDILLRALRDNTPWAPHLLCAFQTPTHLNLIMDYAEGGSLWDVLESSPHENKILESDVRWWAPQVVSAIHWCHSQGFVHRDIKPQNLVLTASSHVQLIDFGSAAPLLPPRADGSQLVPKRYCLVPCGTCDYISPEILEAHEKALVALDMEEDNTESIKRDDSDGYGRETDWWSFGVMLYEMIYGAAPFFAKDIRTTYLQIVDHRTSLRFDSSVQVSPPFRDLLKSLMTGCEERLGRRSVSEIVSHTFFDGVDWSNVHAEQPPADLHIPQYTYSTPAAANPIDEDPVSNGSHSQGFSFSHLFESSPVSSQSRGMSIQNATPAQRLSRSAIREKAIASFIGFSWGPRIEAFQGSTADLSGEQYDLLKTPQPRRFSLVPPSSSKIATGAATHPFVTPVRRSHAMMPHTLPRTGTIGRTDSRRPVSDREAMKQLLECVGMSARKKVIESGRKPKSSLGLGRPLSLNRQRSSSLRIQKELRFDVLPVLVDDRIPESSSMSVPTSFQAGFESTEEETDTDGPPSPSPSPRPNSAMSMGSRRSGTPTLTLSSMHSGPLGRISSEPVRDADRDRTGSRTRTILSDAVLDEIELRHVNLLRDIASIQSRIDRLSFHHSPE